MTLCDTQTSKISFIRDEISVHLGPVKNPQHPSLNDKSLMIILPKKLHTFLSCNKKQQIKKILRQVNESHNSVLHNKVT